jgi:hypothetical protein
LGSRIGVTSDMVYLIVRALGLEWIGYR